MVVVVSFSESNATSTVPVHTMHKRSAPIIAFAIDIERKEPHESTGYRIAHPLVIVAG